MLRVLGPGSDHSVVYEFGGLLLVPSTRIDHHNDDPASEPVADAAGEAYSSRVSWAEVLREVAAIDLPSERGVYVVDVHTPVSATSIHIPRVRAAWWRSLAAALRL